MNVRHHFVLDFIEERIMKVMFVQSNSKSTYIFTNNLAFGTFKKHSKFVLEKI